MSDTLETIAKDLKIGYSKLVIKQEQTKEGVSIAYPMLEVDWQGIARAILERDRQEKECTQDCKHEDIRCQKCGHIFADEFAAQEEAERERQGKPREGEKCPKCGKYWTDLAIAGTVHHCDRQGQE